MVKLIFITLIVIALIFKMRSNLKYNNAVEGVTKSLEKHSPEEWAEILKWEQVLRFELTKAKLLLRKGEITDHEFIAQSKFLLGKHKEIEQKYNVTEEEIVKYYQDSQTLNRSNYDSRQ